MVLPHKSLIYFVCFVFSSLSYCGVLFCVGFDRLVTTDTNVLDNSDDKVYLIR